ncbi:MAG: tRNA preQ1(34) S-adenosylmethionine ribosyltransferase-isomerase QueA [Chloroflexi bacterium RBG_13_57_8]|nr:MAG: tRNA preQ1(34) S-adenosylmethionine ribosyltransferase-isomerase QueA [Chloroflexi bacterium RBG_13_57_8]
MKTSDFDYHLPTELIAQTPIEPRDSSRLMVVDRKTGSIQHRHFYDILEYLHQGDVMVFNDSRVIPARLKGKRQGSGGMVEILLLRRKQPGLWEALVKPAKRLHTGAVIEMGDGVRAEIRGEGEKGIREIYFPDESLLAKAGEVPLPPYIHEPLADPERYQTVYARVTGSVAAPTAGLHFTPGLLEKIQAKGISCLFTTLHVGLDTFRPITEEDPRRHTIYREYGAVSNEVTGELNRARREKRRIICVGTTTVRLLEQAALIKKDGEIPPFADWVELFILPGHRFRVVGAMVTNFHLPRSTLLMLVTAFGGSELVAKAYREAIAARYRFYSFGDAMLIL